MKAATLAIQHKDGALHLTVARGAAIGLTFSIDRSDLAPPFTEEDAVDAALLVDQFHRLATVDLTANERWLLDQLGNAWARLEALENPKVVDRLLTPNEADRLARLLLGAVFIATGAEEEWVT